MWRLRDGLLVDASSGGDGIDPFESGRTAFELRPYLRRQAIGDGGDDRSFDEQVIAASFEWDDTDYPQNPSRGLFTRLTVKQGLGLRPSTQDWTAIEAEVSGYVPFELGSWSRQCVLAVDLWTADTPSWDDDGTGRPPPYDAARLGGIYRMRGYPSYRFHDRAALYGTAEPRWIPDWNPLRGGILRSLEIDWIQLVGFAEWGRVAPTWSLSELTADLRSDVGFGLRLMARKTVVRVEAAFSDETWGMWVMAGHPFGSR